MRELIYNLQPSIVVFIGIAILSLFQKTPQDNKVSTVREMPNRKLRIFLWFALILGISFMISILFAPKGYVLQNALIIFVIAALYGVRKMVKSDRPHNN